MHTPATYSEQRFSIYPTYIVSTPVFSGGNYVRSKAQRQAEVNLSDNTTKGQLSAKAQTRLRNSVNWLVQSASYKRVFCKAENKSFWFKVNFITLTVPSQGTTDIEPKRLQAVLHTFIAYARKYFYLRNYVWKIERGRKGKLHIHMTADTFIHYRKLRDCWNRILMKHGLSDDYYNTHGHYDPNSTDVHSVRKIKNLGGYICKYMSKDTSLGEKFSNRIWGCNYELSAKNKCTYLATPDELIAVASPLLHSSIKWNELLGKPDSLGQRKRIGEIFFVNTDTWSRIIKGRLRQQYDYHRAAIRDNTIKPTIGYYVLDTVKADSSLGSPSEPVKRVVTIPIKTAVRVPVITLFD